MSSPSTFTREEAQMFYDFAFGDIPRALDAGVNFMIALSLLCYTEYIGRMINDSVGLSGVSRRSFETGFHSMGDGYREFDKQLKRETGQSMYKMFRCGMVHSYFTERGLVATRNKGTLGVGWNSEHVPGIAAENYAQDLKNIFETKVLSQFK